MIVCSTLQITEPEPFRRFYLIKDNVHVIGNADAYFSKGHEDAALSGIFVHSGHRRKGFGARLVQEIAMFCRRKGAKYLRVMIPEGDEDSLDFFTRANFAPDPEPERFETPGFTLLRRTLR